MDDYTYAPERDGQLLHPVVNEWVSIDQMNADAPEQFSEWLLFARMGGDISAQEAATRLSAAQKAKDAGVAIPDIRSSVWRQLGDREWMTRMGYYSA